MKIASHQIQSQTIEVATYVGLSRPLLVAKAAKGFLACGYINPLTCDKTVEACAIVSGVNNFDDMKSAKVIALSKSAIDLGVELGDSGETALLKMG